VYLLVSELYGFQNARSNDKKKLKKRFVANITVGTTLVPGSPRNDGNDLY